MEFSIYLHSRSRKWEWNFMEFSFPFPKIGLEFSTWIPVPEKWEWNLPFPVPVPEVQKSFPLMAVSQVHWPVARCFGEREAEQAVSASGPFEAITAEVAAQKPPCPINPD